MASMAPKRLQKELVKLQGPLPPGIYLVEAKDLRSWTMDIEIFSHTLYPPGSRYRLRFSFGNGYPIEAPEVIFLQIDSADPSQRRAIPLHPHIYSNGIICLDLLDKEGWSPVHNVESVCLSLQSMLASNTKAERPPGDAEFTRTHRSGSSRGVNFLFHDNHV